MTDLFDGYPLQQAFDEMLDRDGVLRSCYEQVHGRLTGLTADEVASRADALARSYLAQGVTFDFAGEERPFPLDVVPRVIAAADWMTVEAGVAQRVRALERFL